MPALGRLWRRARRGTRQASATATSKSKIADRIALAGRGSSFYPRMRLRVERDVGRGRGYSKPSMVPVDASTRRMMMVP